MENDQSLPFTIRRAFGRDVTRRTVHVGDAASALSRIRILSGIDRPVFLIGDWVSWYFAHVTGRNQILERLRQLAFVRGVLIDQRAHAEQIVPQH